MLEDPLCQLKGNRRQFEERMQSQLNRFAEGKTSRVLCIEAGKKREEENLVFACTSTFDQEKKETALSLPATDLSSPWENRCDCPDEVFCFFFFFCRLTEKRNNGKKRKIVKRK